MVRTGIHHWEAKRPGRIDRRRLFFVPDFPCSIPGGADLPRGVNGFRPSCVIRLRHELLGWFVFTVERLRIDTFANAAKQPIAKSPCEYCRPINFVVVKDENAEESSKVLAQIPAHRPPRLAILSFVQKRIPEAVIRSPEILNG